VSAASDSEFPGAKVGPDDPRYVALSTGFNQRFAGTPAYIQLCGSAEQVRRAVQDALDAGKRVTVRGGGHCYEGFVSNNPGGVIIDLSPLNAVYREGAMGGAYCVEGGCTLWNVYTALYREFGVTIPGGSCYSVGAGGHICGGGYGLLSRKHGLTVDHLKRDLFWGHIGGGANFGVVTRYWFSAELPQASRDAYLSSLAWNWSDIEDEGQFARLLRNYGTFFAEHSAPWDRTSAVSTSPPT